MGLFSKKKKAAKKNAEDYDVFSASGLVEFVKANLDNPTPKNISKAIKAIAEPDKDQKHLTPDGELPWGWLSRNMPTLKAKYEDKIVKLAVDLKKMKAPTERKAQLEKLIALYYEYKAFCYSKDECFIKYFSDMWEHCHNSRCKDFEYITPYKAELEKLTAEAKKKGQEKHD